MQSYERECKRLWPAVLSFLLMFSGFGCASNTATGTEDPVKEFNERVQKYIQLQKQAISSVPAIPADVSDPAIIIKHEQQIADSIRMLRPNAMPGEIFIPPIRPMIVSTIKSKLDGKIGEDARDTVLGEGNPKNAEEGAAVKLTVNAPYPTTAPLSTVPASLLMALPTLPENLEYRFVGRNLILRDAKANLIVDILPDAFGPK